MQRLQGARNKERKARACDGLCVGLEMRGRRDPDEGERALCRGLRWLGPGGSDECGVMH